MEESVAKGSASFGGSRCSSSGVARARTHTLTRPILLWVQVDPRVWLTRPSGWIQVKLARRVKFCHP